MFYSASTGFSDFENLAYDVCFKNFINSSEKLVNKCADCFSVADTKTVFICNIFSATVTVTVEIFVIVVNCRDFYCAVIVTLCAFSFLFFQMGQSESFRICKGLRFE